jgi:hypothetical protein
VPPLERVSYFCKRGVWSVWQPAFVDRLQGQDVRDVPLKGIKQEETYHTLQRITLDGRGFFGLPGSHGPPKGVAGRGDVVILGEWREGVRRIAQICEEAGMTLEFAPVSADVARARNFGPLQTYDPPFMWDALHLNAAGVEKFQAGVAKDVQTALTRRACVLAHVAAGPSEPEDPTEIPNAPGRASELSPKEARPSGVRSLSAGASPDDVDPSVHR